MTMLRHDAPITIHVDSGLYGQYEHKCTADMVETALAIEALKHGKVSGMMSSVRVKYNLSLDDPAFELKDGELCVCAKCVLGEVDA